MRASVEQALELIREERPESLGEALALLQNTVFAFSMKVCGHQQDAEDTMQDVLLKSIPHLAKFDNPQGADGLAVQGGAQLLHKPAQKGLVFSRQEPVPGRADAFPL